MDDQAALFSAAMDEAMDGISILDLEGRIIYCNRASGELSGIAPGELAGRHIREIHADPDFADSVILPVVKNRGRWSGETTIPCAEGREIPVWLSASLVRNSAAEPVAIVCVTRDLTRRKQAEADLICNADTESTISAILQLALESLPMEVILSRVLDRILAVQWLSLEARGGIFLTQGDSASLVLKASRGLSESIQMRCAEVPPETCLCGIAAATGELQFAETIDDRHHVRYEGMKPHGHYCVPILLSGKVLGVITLYLPEGHRAKPREQDFLRAIANTLAGVIQRKTMESEREALIGELQRLIETITRAKKAWQDTFDSITDLIAFTDSNFVIVRANRAFAEHLHRTPGEVTGRNYHALVYQSEQAPAGCPLAAALRKNKPVVREVQSPDKIATFLVSAFPSLSPDGVLQGVISVMRDITGIKEQEVRVVINERLAALGRMASGIAHEINNPLAAINGCAEGLMTRINRNRYDPEFFKSYLTIIQEEIFRCKSITTGMLSFVKQESYDKKVVDLHGLLEKTVDVLGYQGKLKNATIVQRLHPGIPPVIGSEGELRQVFLAIITNALDAMREAGTVVVATAVERNFAVVAIEDRGPGIPEELQAKIFDPFFTTRSDKGGTGLGLAIASKIVTNHGGTIGVASTPGKGAIFSIRLPLLDGPPPV